MKMPRGNGANSKVRLEKFTVIISQEKGKVNMSMENNKTLAICDMAIKISENTPVDVVVTYYGTTKTVDLRIFWKGFNGSADDRTDYRVPGRSEPCFPNETSADDMLRILEEIYSGGSNG